MLIKYHQIFSFLLIVLFISCGTYKAPFIKSINDNQLNESLPDKKKKHVLYLVGDSGDVDAPDSEHNYVLSYLTQKITAGNEKKQSVE